ncbi:MAG TPA: thiamine-phosphate kinase [Terracidiphilus sp.]|nr:thiamine-phosphate kinase [Terracidiphilus sp.]
MQPCDHSIIGVRGKKNSTGSRTGELDLIRQIRDRSASGGARRGVTLGIGDDCALLRPGRDEEIAVTTDMSIDGRHFLLNRHPPEVVGHRTLARGLSDLAAMGARPLAAFVSLGVPKRLTTPGRSGESWVSRFYDGLLALAAEYETALAGGDLAESPVAVADIVLVGAVKRGRALLRSGARAGDAIYVTGQLGGAAAGLERLMSSQLKVRSSTIAVGRSKKDALLVGAHSHPQPRVAQGRWLAQRGAATAAIDLSDGLSTDLAHVCEESGMAAEVNAAMLPVAPLATLEQALHGGEDYELLFTAREGLRIPGSITGVKVTRIGRMVRHTAKRPRVALITANDSKQPLEPRGWQHFD